MAHAGKSETEHADVAIHGSKFYYVTWTWLLALTAVEVFLAYEQLNLHLMIVLLMGLSVVKAGLIMSNFMHLRFEKRSLVLTLVPTMVIVIALLVVFFPDSFRLLELRVVQ